MRSRTSFLVPSTHMRWSGGDGRGSKRRDLVYLDDEAAAEAGHEGN